MTPIAIKFGGYQQPASIHNRAAGLFGEVLKSRLGEQVTFELVGNVLDLGRMSGDLPKMVESGELAFCYMSTVRFTPYVPEFKLLELPFVVPDRATAHRAFAGTLGAYFARRMQESSPFRLLGLWDNGFRHVTNKVRPIHLPIDCKGLRLRTQISELHGEVFSALGFEPIAVDVKEFVDKVAGDTFDGQDNPLTNTWNFGVHRYHRHVTLSGHLFGATALICRQSVYQGWPEHVRTAVDEAARQSTAHQLALAGAEDEEILAKIDPAQNDVVHLTATERAAFVAAVQPVLEKYRRELDPQLFAMLAGQA